MSLSSSQLVSAFVATFTVMQASVAHATDAGTQPDADVGAVPAELAAFDASLTQTSSTDEPIHAGETLTVTYEITHPAGAQISFPEAYEPERWVLVDATPRGDTSEGATTSIWVATFGIYRPGRTTLKPFDITIADAAGNEVTLSTEPVEAKVISLFTDVREEPTFHDARAPVEVWVEDYTLAYLGGGAMLLALIGLIAWWLRRRQLMQPAPPPPPRAPHEVALEKLGAIAGDDLVERGEFMLYWVRMSEAIREYLGRTYGFPGTELTTTEMLGILSDVTWPTGLGLEDVTGFLRRCDEVKFGGAEPGVDESTTSLRRAFSIVELTKPRRPVPAEDEAEDDAERAEEPPAQPGHEKWAEGHEDEPTEDTPNETATGERENEKTAGDKRERPTERPKKSTVKRKRAQGRKRRSIDRDSENFGRKRTAKRRRKGPVESERTDDEPAQPSGEEE